MVFSWWPYWQQRLFRKTLVRSARHLNVGQSNWGRSKEGKALGTARSWCGTSLMPNRTVVNYLVVLVVVLAVVSTARAAKPVFYTGDYRTADGGKETAALRALGMQEAAIVTSDVIWNHRLKPTYKYKSWRWDDPSTHGLHLDYPYIQRWLNSAAKRGKKRPRDTLLVLDIEHIVPYYRHVKDQAKARVGRDYLRDVVGLVKANVVCKGVGLWAMIPDKPSPTTEYTTPVRMASSRENNWGLDANGQRVEDEGLADAVDFIAPHCYMLHQFDTVAMVRRVTVAIEESRQYGKPVYPFIWSQWSEAADRKDLRGKQIPANTMLAIFQVIELHADGAFLWAPPIKWRDDMPWIEAWKAMRQETGTWPMVWK